MLFPIPIFYCFRNFCNERYLRSIPYLSFSFYRKEIRRVSFICRSRLNTFNRTSVTLRQNSYSAQRHDRVRFLYPIGLCSWVKFHSPHQFLVPCSLVPCSCTYLRVDTRFVSIFARRAVNVEFATVRD